MVVAIGVLLVIQMVILGLNLHGVYRIVTMALFPVLFVAGMILLISSVAVLIVVLLFVFIFQVLFASKKEADAAVANRCCKNCYHYAATQGTCQHTGNHHANPERERCTQHSFHGEHL